LSSGNRHVFDQGYTFDFSSVAPPTDKGNIALQHHFFRNSLHLGAGELPQGMIGTVEVEFCGDPSMILSL
jgi:hypothetical protein